MGGVYVSYGSGLKFLKDSKEHQAYLKTLGVKSGKRADKKKKPSKKRRK